MVEEVRPFSFEISCHRGAAAELLLGNPPERVTGNYGVDLFSTGCGDVSGIDPPIYRGATARLLDEMVRVICALCNAGYLAVPGLHLTPVAALLLV